MVEHPPSNHTVVGWRLGDGAVGHPGRCSAEGLPSLACHLLLVMQTRHCLRAPLSSSVALVG